MRYPRSPLFVVAVVVQKGKSERFALRVQAKSCRRRDGSKNASPSLKLTTWPQSTLMDGILQDGDNELRPRPKPGFKKDILRRYIETPEAAGSHAATEAAAALLSTAADAVVSTTVTERVAEPVTSTSATITPMITQSTEVAIQIIPGVIRPIPLPPAGTSFRRHWFNPQISNHTPSSAPPGATHFSQLSHHGFTPPRVQPTPQPPTAPPPPVNTGHVNPSIHLSSEVELTRVTPTTFLILSEPPRRPEPPGLGFNAIKPPQQTPVPIMAHRLTPTQNQQPLPDSTMSPAMASASVPVSEPHLAAGNQVGGGARTRRQQKPDDLVPPGCGLTRSDIVELPIDDFNDKVAEKPEQEVLVLKDRRRRGKNRVRLEQCSFNFLVRSLMLY